jgi:hypothetical protein
MLMAASVKRVTVNPSIFLFDADVALQVKEVADIHLDSSHTVFSIRTDCDFSSPKLFPSTTTKVEPENTLNHSGKLHHVKYKQVRQHDKGVGRWGSKEERLSPENRWRITCTGMICKRNTSGHRFCGVNWSKGAGQHEQSDHHAKQEPSRFGREACK